MVNQLLFASAVGLAGTATAALDTILPLPPMGFNSWARFMTDINEDILVEQAKVMTKTGLREVGFNRINLDDGWSAKSRADNGSRVWDPKKFPQGLPRLTSRFKSEGYIPGIFTSAASASCADSPGSMGHEEIDHRDFVAWGFEFVKVDGCNLAVDGEEGYHDIYGRWHKILSESNTPMVFSNSAPAYFSGQQNLTDWNTAMGWAQKYGQLARHSADAQNFPDGNAWRSMVNNYQSQIRLGRYPKSGFFNDPDLLNFDHPSYTLDEKKSQFALWCILAAPLFLSANLTAMTPEEVKFLTNKDLIAINQDRLVQQATLVRSDEKFDVLSKSLENGDRVLAILNKGDAAGDLSVDWWSIGLDPKELSHQGKDIAVKNLWTGEEYEVRWRAGVQAKAIPSHGTAVFRIAKTASQVTPTGLIFNTNTMNCLTDHDPKNGTLGTVTFQKCDGSLAQTWRVLPDGSVINIWRLYACLIVKDGQIKSLQPGPGLPCDLWTYQISGNLVNNMSKQCLTENKDGAAVTTTCGHEANEQVVGLPIGVTVIGN